MVKKIVIGVIVLLVVIQFFRPERNLSNDRAYDVSTKYALSESVDLILNEACKDCHSNSTEYPWYASVQPTGMWLNFHVEDGKRHLNFSDFTSAPIAIQNHRFEEIIEVLESGEMPLPSYTWFGLHEGANLSEDQKLMLTDWARNQMNMLRSQYPADSLVMSFPGPPPGI